MATSITFKPVVKFSIDGDLTKPYINMDETNLLTFSTTSAEYGVRLVSADTSGTRCDLDNFTTVQLIAVQHVGEASDANVAVTWTDDGNSNTITLRPGDAPIVLPSADAGPDVVLTSVSGIVPCLIYAAGD